MTRIVHTKRHRSSIVHWSYSIALSLAGTLLSIASVAQQLQPAAGASGGLQEVVVTALRRTENLQDTPAAVTAVSGDLLEQREALVLADLNGTIPGLAVVGGDPGLSQFAIRGLSTGGGDLTTSPTVGYYFNDTPVTLNFSFEGGQVDPSYYDLARVEVLRGPQGTLYGASSMGGTIRLIFNQPVMGTFESRVNASTSYTAYGGWNYEVNGLVNLPVTEDTLSLRASVFSRALSGYIDRVTSAHGVPTNTPPFTVTDVNDNNRTAEGGRLTLLYKPNDVISVTPEVFYQKTWWASGTEIDQALSTGSELVVNNLFREPGSDTTTLPSLTVKATSQRFEVTSSTAYYDRVHSQVQDYSEFATALLESVGVGAGAIFPSPETQSVGSHQFTEEIRAASRDTGAWHWLAGAFYLHNVSTDDQAIPIIGLTAATGGSLLGLPDPGDLAFAKNQRMITVQKAVFGELSFDFLPNLTGTVGLRHFNITNEFRRSVDGPLAGGPSTVNLGQAATGNTPKFLLSYTAEPGKLLYLSATKGFRAGGVNEPVPAALCAGDLATLGLTSAPTTFNPDYVWSYEAGAKTDWLGNRLRINAAVYDIEWTDIQVPIFLPTCGFPFTSNSGKARSRGVEVELDAALIKGLTFSVSTSYDQANLTADIPFEPGTDGQSLLNVPKVTSAASIDYSFPLAGDVGGFVRADYKYYGKILQGYTVAPQQYVPSYDTVGAGAGIRIKRFNAEFFARNVTNKRGFYSLLYEPSYGPLVHNYDRGFLIPPRVVGISLSYEF